MPLAATLVSARTSFDLLHGFLLMIGYQNSDIWHVAVLVAVQHPAHWAPFKNSILLNPFDISIAHPKFEFSGIPES